MEQKIIDLNNPLELIEPLSLKLEFDLPDGIDGLECDPTGLITCLRGKV